MLDMSVVIIILSFRHLSSEAECFVSLAICVLLLQRLLRDVDTLSLTYKGDMHTYNQIRFH